MNQTIIMIIDDEEQMRKMIRTFLEKDGYKVIEATDGVHALSLLNKTKPHLLIVDVMMPFMDGFAFAKEVKLNSPSALIFLAAKVEEWDKIGGLKVGGYDYIVKPGMPGELLARVESVLRSTDDNKMATDILPVGPLMLEIESRL